MLDTSSPAALRALWPQPYFYGQAPSALVSAADLPHIKTAAQAMFPWVKPTLRLEIVARALRFGSYAAMTTALKRATPENPLLLQMAFGERPGMINKVFDDLFEDTSLDLADLEHRALCTVIAGPAFLSALYTVREGSLGACGRDCILRVGIDDEIGALHRTVTLQSAPDYVREFLTQDGAVLRLPNGVMVAPVARVASLLRADEDEPILIDELEESVDYDLGYVDYSGEGSRFGAIALDNAVFVSDNQSGIDVLPLGWTCSWPFSVGAVFTDWFPRSKEEKLAELRLYMNMLTRELDVPANEVGTAFRLVPELKDTPEARSARDVVSADSFEGILAALFDGKYTRAN
jgi:hypothetical protein